MKYSELVTQLDKDQVLGTVKTPNIAEIAKKHNVTEDQIRSELRKGIQVEAEHTDDLVKRAEIALDHLSESPTYYTDLAKIDPHEITEMRTDSDEFFRLDAPDRWLAKYTYENLDKFPSKETVAALIKRYPNDAQTVYRGLNFRTKEDWEEFEKNIEDGSIDISRISSWSPSAKEAYTFAITQPSYFLDLQTMQDYEAAEKAGEEISGYRGVILQLELEQGTAIDVDKSKLGHESEIIVPAGTYPADIYRVVKKFEHQLADKDTDIDTVIQSTTIEKYNDSKQRKFFDYVMKNHVDELSNKSRHHLFNMLYRNTIERFKDGKFIKTVLNDELPDLTSEETVPESMSVYYPYMFLQYAMKGYFLDDDTQTVKQVAQKIVKHALQAIKTHYSERRIEAGNLLDIARFAGMYQEALNVYQETFGKQYRDLEQKGRDINKLPPEQRRDAISQHIEDLQKVMNQIS